jgi:hypothetical protein
MRGSLATISRPSSNLTLPKRASSDEVRTVLASVKAVGVTAERVGGDKRLTEIRATIPSHATLFGEDILIHVGIDDDDRLVGYFVGHGPRALP